MDETLSAFRDSHLSFLNTLPDTLSAPGNLLQHLLTTGTPAVIVKILFVLIGKYINKKLSRKNI